MVKSFFCTIFADIDYLRSKVKSREGQRLLYVLCLLCALCAKFISITAL